MQECSAFIVQKLGLIHLCQASMVKTEIRGCWDFVMPNSCSALRRNVCCSDNIHPPPPWPSREVYVAVTGKTFCSSAHASFVFFAKYPVSSSEFSRFDSKRAMAA